MNFSNEMTVNLIDSMGDEASIVSAARVSVNPEQALQREESEGLIRFLMRNRHASPFEHATVTFFVDVPIFVSREWMRHRTQSFNETSGRYRELEPKFYWPASFRPITQKGKPGAYEFALGTEEQEMELDVQTELAYTAAWQSYYNMLEIGIAREVARNVLPVGVYTQFYATANLRNWLNFLSLRSAPDALFEIRQAAAYVEDHLIEMFPTVLDAWDANGRGAL